MCVAISTLLPQEDISRLRRKLETTKKPDNVPKCDEILMEEIKDYKVRETDSVVSVRAGSDPQCIEMVDTDLYPKAEVVYCRTERRP